MPAHMPKHSPLHLGALGTKKINTQTTNNNKQTQNKALEGSLAKEP